MPMIPQVDIAVTLNDMGYATPIATDGGGSAFAVFGLYGVAPGNAGVNIGDVKNVANFPGYGTGFTGTPPHVNFALGISRIDEATVTSVFVEATSASFHKELGTVLVFDITNIYATGEIQAKTLQAWPGVIDYTTTGLAPLVISNQSAGLSFRASQPIIFDDATFGFCLSGVSDGSGSLAAGNYILLVKPDLSTSGWLPDAMNGTFGLFTSCTWLSDGINYQVDGNFLPTITSYAAQYNFVTGQTANILGTGDVSSDAAHAFSQPNFNAQFLTKHGVFGIDSISGNDTGCWYCSLDCSVFGRVIFTMPDASLGPSSSPTVWLNFNSSLTYKTYPQVDDDGNWWWIRLALCDGSGNLILEPLTSEVYSSVSTPPSSVCPVAWLAINEPGTSSPFTPNTWVDQSHRLPMSEAISISWLVRQRGTAKIPLTISGDDSYMPTIGSQVCLWDITALADFEVFSGTIDDFEVHWHGQTGQRIVTLTCVSLDQVFDTIRVPSLLFTDKTAGFIFTALFAYATGSPVTLGTVDAGATIAQFVIQDWPSIAEMFTRLATISEYVWGVDPGTGSVYFHAPNVTPSPFTLDAHDVVWERFDLKEERHDYRNRQILKPNVNTAVSSSEYFQGSAQSSFTMLRPVDQITNAFLTQNTQNSALGTFTGQPSPGDRITVGYASTSGSGFRWSAAATFAAGAIIVDSNGYFQKVTASAGVTGATEPVWVEIFGQVTNDNLVTWTNQGPAGFADGNAADYTFVTALDNREFGQVLIGATLPDTITNLWHAINSIQGFAGATFSLPTWENPLLNADTPTATTLTVRNKPAGQGFIAALAWTGAVFSFDSNVTHGGITTFGTNVITFGVEGQTTGGSIFTIVYNPGSNIVKSATPLQPGNNLQIEYKASNAGFVIVENTAEVIDRARIEGGTGKYQQSSSDDTATSLPQALQLAQQQLAAFDTIPKTFQFTCMRAGLYVGQVLDISMANPQPALTNASWFIQEIQAEVVPIYGPGGVANRWLPNGGHFKYTVTCIDVAQIGSWLDFWLGLGSGGSGGGSAVYPGGGATSSTTTSGAARIIATGAAALNTAAIASGAAAATVTVATPGVLGTDTLAWSFNADPTGVTGYAPSATGTLYIVAFPVAGNVKFIVVNNTGAPITPGAITLNFNVVR